ncbi:hypothetical protein JGS22_006980 [Streptomyces sp. P38-E01]|uniref:Uncharacterized protein n=1 Tax=Streptomyces tardus TaxID=2780544 RepID=A0A949N4W6_9ACTN|nr:restriction endonuclease subunit S [Streptomyces tardus]MBU7597382.1 hypothetical protein [Streptomyces tardus]
MTEPAGWKPGTLDDVLEHVDVRNKDKAVEMVLSVTEGRGIVPQSEVFNKRVATEDTSKYKVLQPFDIAWNPYLLWTGAIGQWLRDSAGVTSPVYPVFRVREGQDARFWGMVLEGGVLTPYFDSRAIGSIARRRRTTIPVFKEAPIFIPPRPTQERIVKIIGAVDDQIAALESEVSTARRLLNSVLAEHFATVMGKPQRIVDLCSHVVGGVWGKPEGEGEVDRLALGPRIYAPGTTDFVTGGSPVRSFTTKQADTRTVREQDIILERSGGSPEQPVGRVAIAGPGLAPCVPTDFQRLMRVEPERALPKWVFWRLRHDWVSGLTRNYSRRTTGITNLSVKEYIAREVPVPSPEEQAALVERAAAVDALVITLRAEATSLRQVRAGLLSGLLDRAITIESAELEVA